MYNNIPEFFITHQGSNEDGDPEYDLTLRNGENQTTLIRCSTSDLIDEAHQCAKSNQFRSYQISSGMRTVLYDFDGNQYQLS